MPNQSTPEIEAAEAAIVKTDLPARGGSRIVDVEATRVRLVEPWVAARYDPPLAEFLRLPVADSCPTDPTHRRWGTANPSGYLMVRYCKDCRTKFRGAPTTYTIGALIDALNGVPLRLWAGSAREDNHDQGENDRR